jgi:hypothetical protein
MINAAAPSGATVGSASNKDGQSSGDGKASGSTGIAGAASGLISKITGGSKAQTPAAIPQTPAASSAPTSPSPANIAPASPPPAPASSTPLTSAKKGPLGAAPSTTTISAKNNPTPPANSPAPPANPFTGKKPKKKIPWKMMAGALVLILMLVGAGAGFLLTQTSQDVRQQASQGTYQEQENFCSSNGGVWKNNGCDYGAVSGTNDKCLNGFLLNTTTGACEAIEVTITCDAGMAMVNGECIDVEVKLGGCQETGGCTRWL